MTAASEPRGVEGMDLVMVGLATAGVSAAGNVMPKLLDYLSGREQRRQHHQHQLAGDAARVLEQVLEREKYLETHIGDLRAQVEGQIEKIAVLEADRVKLASRLQDVTEQLENSHSQRLRLAKELADVRLQLERHEVICGGKAGLS